MSVQESYPATPLLVARASAPVRTLGAGAMLLSAGSHAILALVILTIPQLGMVHSLVVLAVGVWWTLVGDAQRLERTVAYVAGAEVLWRMTESGIFWEYGKYAVVALLGLALLRRRALRSMGLPLLFLVLLLPSAIMTVIQTGGLLAAREMLSFNLSGPLAVFACVWYFTDRRMDLAQFGRLVQTSLGPLVGVATLALHSLLTTPTIAFADESNVAASGGFGPNQVSAVLGMGALLCLLLLLAVPLTRPSKLVTVGLLTWLLGQAVMTFSRGGVLSFLISAAVAIVLRMRVGRGRTGTTLLVAVLAGLMFAVVLPQLNAFTDSALAARYSDTDLTGRDAIAQSDLQLFLARPLTGVGAGLSPQYRPYVLGPVAPHTEFTRLLAEHGLLGVGAMLALLAVAGRCAFRTNDRLVLAVTVSLALWPLTFMLHAGLRIVAPAFMLGLAVALSGVAAPPGADSVRR